MKRRWIIRSFFIGLLLLCVGGWAGSYAYIWSISYSGRTVWVVDSYYGKIRLQWLDEKLSAVFEKGWLWQAGRARSDDAAYATWLDSNGRWFLGFYQTHSHEELVLKIPLWFPTTLSAALLWLAWRKTRSQTKGRAFPVEAAAADGGHK